MNSKIEKALFWFNVIGFVAMWIFSAVTVAAYISQH